MYKGVTTAIVVQETFVVDITDIWYYPYTRVADVGLRSLRLEVLLTSCLLLLALHVLFELSVQVVKGFHNKELCSPSNSDLVLISLQHYRPQYLNESILHVHEFVIIP